MTIHRQIQGYNSIFSVSQKSQTKESDKIKNSVSVRYQVIKSDVLDTAHRRLAKTTIDLISAPKQELEENY